jgi:hypothetical protein
MLLGSKLGMVPGMKIMRMGKMRMVRSLVMIACFMVLRGFGVVVCSQSVMMSRLLVVVRRLLRHREISIPPADFGSSVRKHVTNLHPRAIRHGLRPIQ